MFISTLHLRNFRNFISIDIDFNKEGALIYGENGTGKTNLIESLYFLSTTRSQRGARKRDMIHSDHKEAYLEGIYKNWDDSPKATVSIGFSHNNKVIVKKNNKKIARISDLYNQSNVISFSSNDVNLVYGDPSTRRRFVDIILSQTDNIYLESLIEYKRNLQNRNSLLSGNHLDVSIEIYEEKLAKYGSYLYIARKEFFSFISSYFNKYYCDISCEKFNATVKYKPSLKCVNFTQEEWEKEYITALKEKRKLDIEYGFTSIGPHRDDFICHLDDNPAKYFCSQGQCRSIALSLRLCSLLFFDKIKPENKILLVDDAFSELDFKRKKNICSLIANRGQLFVTTLSKDETFFNYLSCIKIQNNSVTSL